ncbi:MAG: hypothetical protein AB8B50_14605, partial [Pirellulaceae bacterium]
PECRESLARRVNLLGLTRNSDLPQRKVAGLIKVSRWEETLPVAEAPTLPRFLVELGMGG